MNKNEAVRFRDEWVAKGARDFTRVDGADVPDLMEFHVEAVKLTPEDFHDLGGQGTIFKKETLDDIANAAGVSFNPSVTRVEEREKRRIGYAQGMTMGPDGQPIAGDVGLYEFDPEVRAELDWIAKPDKYTGDIAKRKLVLEYCKIATSRANTGSRSRAIISILGLQTSFKDLFKGKREEVFLFSRIMFNPKNKLMAEALLAGARNNTALLFGAQAAGSPRQIEATHRPLTEAEDVSLEPEVDTVDPGLIKKADLLDLLDVHGANGNVSADAVGQIKAEVDAMGDVPFDEIRLARLDYHLKRIRDFLTKKGVVL